MKDSKVYIYVKNQYNDKIGIYSFNNEKIVSLEKTETSKHNMPIKEINSTVEGIENNIHSRIMMALLMESLSYKDISIDLVKCVKRIKQNLIYLVRINVGIENKEVDFLCFNKCIDKTEIKLVSRHIKKYGKTNERKVWKTKLSAMGVGVSDVIISIISAAVIVLSIMKIVQGNKEYSLIFCISLLMSLLELISVVTKKITKWRNFTNELDLVSMTDTVLKEEIVRNATEIKTKKYKNYTSLKFREENGSIDCFLISDEENSNLSKSASKIKVILSKYKHTSTKDSRRALANVISTKLAKDKFIFNGKLLGIATDLNFKNTSVVQVKKVRYNDYVSLDEIIYKNVLIATEPSYFFKGSTVSINPETKALKDIEKSPLTNLIGVNLILELVITDTNEKYFVVNEQTSYNDANGGKLVPTSSGSLEQKDFKVLKKRAKDITLDELLKCGMYRELKEESYIDEDFLLNHKANFSILGVARLISKGGKPDFFGKCTIQITKKESKDILKHFNDSQAKYIGTKNTVESNFMVYIDKDSFLDKGKESLYTCSPQLQYFHYLLKKKHEIEKKG